MFDQEMQSDLDRETASLQELEAQKQDAQDRLEEMDQQKHKLEDMLNEVRIKCQEESQMVRMKEELEEQGWIFLLTIINEDSLFEFVIALLVFCSVSLCFCSAK